MIGVCLGIGDDWYDVACVAAEQMSHMTGLKCVVIERPLCETAHPSWNKCKIVDSFDDDSFLVFDADIICVQRWTPLKLFQSVGRAFCAVPDTRDQVVWDECNELGISFPDCYVNAGLTMFGREHAPIWRETFKYHPKCGRFLEQGALNLSLLNSGIEVCRLPRYFNVMMNGDRGMKAIPDQDVVHRAINVHACGTKSVQGVKNVQDKYGLRLSQFK